jgi:hypothetical protein
MGLSRKRERELKRLRSSASDLWDDQREVLEHASKVVREAGRQVGYLGREEVVPRVRGTIDDRIKPSVYSARNKLTHEVLPSVASAIASALAVIEVAKNAKVKEVTRQLEKASKKASAVGSKAAVKVGLRQEPKRKGPGRYILMGLGLVAAASVAYAAWQTLREDDDLWVTDEFTEPPAAI